jgi:hypothetical protein
MSNFIHTIDRDFVEICGFKERPFRKKLIISKIWNELDAFRGSFQSFKKYLKSFRVDLLIDSNSLHDHLQIPVGGFYCPENNRIELILYTENFDMFLFDDYQWYEFKFSFMQVFCHEIVHMMQFSNRDYVWSYRRCKFRKVKMAEINEDRKYHASLDEIQAYAHCIFLELMETGIGVPKCEKERKLYNCSATYSMLLRVFGNKVSEPTIQKTMYHVSRWAKRYNVS